MRSAIAAATLTLGLTSCAAGDMSPSAATEVATFTATALPSVAATPTSTIASAEPATEPPAANPSPTEVADQRLSVLTAAVNGLRLRQGPGLAADPLVYRCTGNFVEVPADCSAPIAVDAGRTMVVFDGPVIADGFDWYLVVLTGREPGAGQLGWAATPEEGDAWLVPAELECPTSAPDVDALAAMDVAMVYCYQALELTLEGWVVTGFGCGGVGTFEPAWLAHPCANASYIRATPPPPMGDQPLFLHYPAPGVTNPTLTFDDGQQVRIAGHYDDPAAMGCLIEPDPSEPAFVDRNWSADDAAADVAVCRMRFVVMKVTPHP